MPALPRVDNMLPDYIPEARAVLGKTDTDVRELWRP